ncbi:c-type cytochrome [Nitratiruptor sp. YY09-18]|uniref:c-type cytochrome n=1 Tax=Nitratiruptor sp. YY09-18 TaxID=2724901 RepID=UPI001915328C|nr:c-type cytochrome [Nitratiruptor sp. YY09-18]BCD68684.1 cytochrome c [Nitratiruptor sp. YY09-18]
MKRLGLISVVAATLLFVGCGNKEEHKAKAQSQQSAVEKKVEAPKPAPAAKQQAPKAEAPKAEAAAQSASSAAEQASEATHNVAQKAKETVEQIKEKATESAKEVVKSATEALPGAKPAQAAAAAAGATAAKEAATKAEPKAAAAPAADKGKELYTKCASCHGQKGNLKALGKSGIIAGMSKDELIKKLKGYKAGTLNQYGMGALMKGQVAGLSDADIEALAVYISTLK